MPLKVRSDLRGQTMVEYLLLMAVVMGVAFAVRAAMVSRLGNVLNGYTTAMRDKGVTGGRTDLKNYYIPDNAEIKVQ